MRWGAGSDAAAQAGTEAAGGRRCSGCTTTTARRSAGARRYRATGARREEGLGSRELVERGIDQTERALLSERVPAGEKVPSLFEPRHRRPAPDPAADRSDGGGGGLPAAAHERGEVTQGCFYLLAVMDRATPHVLAWRLSNTMDTFLLLRSSRRRAALARAGDP